MKLMERFGTPILSYEGSCQGSFKEANYKLDYSGYFEAALYPSGRVAIGIMTTGPLRCSIDESQSVHDPTLTFAGTSSDGWSIPCIEQTIFNRTSWQIAPIIVQPDVHLISAQRFEASYRDGNDGFHYSARFLISNFLWHDSERNNPEIVEFSAKGFRVAVTPIEDYRTVASQLIGGGGIQPTACVYIQCADELPRPLSEYASFLDELLCVFRLVTGNEVSWYYGEAPGPSNQPVARIHNYSSPMPYSNTVRLRHVDGTTRTLVQKLDLAELVMASFNQADWTLDKATMEKLVNQFTNATNATPSLEASALLASTLTEMIASKFANAKGESNFITSELYKKNIRPTLEEAIRNTGLSDEIQLHLNKALTGVRRRSFADKIRLLCNELTVPLSDDEITRIVKIRNELVHRGTFPPVSEDSSWLRQYNFIIWTDLMFLCRLMGYGGAFTEQRNPEQIEV